MTTSNNLSLDHEVLSFLKEATEEMFPEIIDAFISDTPKRLILLNQAARDNDLATLTEESHSIKGSSSNLGAKQLSSICADIEHESRNSQLNNQTENVKLAEIEFEKVKKELTLFLSQ